MNETGKALAVPGICGGVGLAAGLFFGAGIGVAIGFATLWGIAILAGNATKPPKEPDLDEILGPDRPRGISISPSCRCEVCEARRQKMFLDPSVN